MRITGSLRKGGVQLDMNGGDRHDGDLRLNGQMVPMTRADMRDLRDLLDAVLKLEELDG